MASYRSQLVTLDDMLAELLATGKTRAQAGRELLRAIEDGAIEFFDVIDLQLSPNSIGPATRIIQAWSNWRPGERLNPAVGYDVIELQRARVLRAKFEAVFGLFAVVADESTTLRRASDPQIRTVIRSVYDQEQIAPNIRRVPKLVRTRLNEAGLDTSDRQIMKIAEEPEFAARRRPVGKRINGLRLFLSH
jgi:hypothetical protein